MKDLFSQLLPLTWRAIEAPCASFEVEVTQDHVEHKWPDRDGAHIEGTGRNPLVFTAKVMFRNGIKAGPTDGFEAGNLYPVAYRLFLAACSDRTSGTLQHPELGKLQVKCKSAKTHWDANKRDGVDVDVVWVETSDKTSIEDVLANPSPVAQASAAAHDLDNAITQYAFANNTGFVTKQPDGSVIVRKIPGLPQQSFSDGIAQVTAVFDQVTLVSKQIKGKINEISYRLDVLGASIDRARDPQTWNMRQSVERLRSSLNDMRTRVLTVTAPISVFRVKQDATLASISVFIGAPVSQILQLNSGLFLGPIVRSGTLVRYYTNLNDKSSRNLFDSRTR